jgi:N4-gp56 family major capsid protein
VPSTLTAITAQQRNYYSLLLLKRMLPRISMHGEGAKSMIPKHMGKTVEWRFLASLPRATTPLSEGVPPSETAMTWTKITGTIDQYGAYVKITDLLAHQAIDDVIHEATEALGENAGLTLHTRLLTILTSTDALATNIRYADAVANRAAIGAANILDAAEIRRARRILAGADVPRFEDGTYHALVHPFTMESLTSDATIMQVASYGAGGVSKQEGVDLLSGVVLKYGGFTFRESTDAPTFASTVTVYASLFYGKDWFAELGLEVRPTGTANDRTAKLSGVTVMGVPVDQATKDDPLGQFGTWGWKAYYSAKILQAERGLRIEHAVAA